MIRYIFGRSSSGKTTKLHQLIEAEKDEKIFVIVPEQYTLEAELHLIHDMNVSGLMNIEIISFNRIAHRIMTESGFNRIEINELGKAMVLRSLLDKHKEDLLVFSRVAEKPGFTKKVSGLISDFKHVGMNSNKLEYYLHPTRNQLVDRKLRDIHNILSLYESFMGSEYFDEEDKLDYVLEHLESSGMFKDSLLFFDGFDSFSYHEHEVIKKLMSLSKEVTFAFTLDINANDEEDQLFTSVASTVTKIREAAKDLGIKEKKLEVDENHKHEDLIWFEREFFAYPYKVYDKDVKNLELHVLNNVYDEIEMVARNIQKNIQDQAYRYKDISIVTGNLEGYASVIKRIFTEYEIPYFIDSKVNVKGHPVVKFIIGLLKCVYSGFKYEDVFLFMKTGFVEINLDDMFLFENFAIKNGLRGKRWYESIEDENLESTRLVIEKTLKAIEETIPKKATVKEYVKSVYQFLLNYNLPDKIDAFMDELSKYNALIEIQQASQIWNHTIDLFDQLIDLQGQDSMTLKDFIRTLDSGFDEMTIGMLPGALDQVIVGSIERTRSKACKMMFVVGVNDGIMPKKYSDEGLILDEEKMSLKNIGLDLKTDSSTILNNDYYATYASMTKASEKLIISYTLADIEGKALRPSVYIDKLKKVFPKMNEKSHMVYSVDPLDFVSKRTHYKHLLKSVRNILDDKEEDSKWMDVLEYYKGNLLSEEEVVTIEEALHYDNQIEKIPVDQAQIIYDLPLKTSVSRLERYMRCPFSHFVHYGLRPKKRDKFEISLPDIGSLFHLTLEHFDRRMKKDNLDWLKVEENQVKVMVEDIVDDLVSVYPTKIFETTHRHRYMVSKLKRVGKRAVWTMVNQVKQGSFIPYAHEIGFALEGYQVVPPIMIELSDGTRMMMEGRIDRIDIYEKDEKKYVRIIDYKSGSKKFSLSEMYQGLQIQLMIYLEAILENPDYFRTHQLHPAGVFYFKIDDPLLDAEMTNPDISEEEIFRKLKMDGILLKDMSIVEAMDSSIIDKRKSNVIPVELKKDETLSSRSSVADEDQFKLMIDYLKNMVKKIGDDITNGVTKIHPIKQGERTGCHSCDYISICQFDSAFDNEYKLIKNLKNDEVFELLEGEKNVDQ